METAYLLFTEQDPITKLKLMASHLPPEKRVALTPHINRASSFVNGSRAFRVILQDEEHTLLSELFKIYFENAITKGRLTIIPKSAGADFHHFFQKVTEPMRLGKVKDAYYSKLIRKCSGGMNDFVSAFVYLKTAEAEYRRLA